MKHFGKGILMMIVTALLLGPTASAHQKGWPGKRLSEAFPDADRFTSRQVSLSADQISRIEQAIGERVEPENRVPTFYSALDKAGKKIGFVLFADQVGENGVIDMGVAVDTQGNVRYVVIFTSREDKRTSQPSFLDQFRGKSLKDPLKLGTDVTPVAGAEKASLAVVTGVRKALLIKQEVFGGQNP